MNVLIGMYNTSVRSSQGCSAFGSGMNAKGVFIAHKVLGYPGGHLLLGLGQVSEAALVNNFFE